MNEPQRYALLFLSIGLCLCAYLFWVTGQDLEALGARVHTLELADLKRSQPRKPKAPVVKPEGKPNGDTDPT